jgi:uncharacterized protein (DUF2237 family)
MTLAGGCLLATVLTFTTFALQGCGVTLQGGSGVALSVTGATLDTCSKPGMALTGFTRDGHCQDLGNDDAGSHHICIQMKPDFCTVTGQPDWCSESMPCMGSSGNCPIGNWCVCQWAFANYIQMAGGCDSIVDLQCDATNLAALHAYEQSSEQVHKDALTCIQKRCGVSQATGQTAF